MDQTFVSVLVVAFFVLALSGAAFVNGLALLRSRGSSAPFGTRLLAFERPRSAPTPQRRPLGLTSGRHSDRAAR